MRVDWCLYSKTRESARALLHMLSKLWYRKRRFVSLDGLKGTNKTMHAENVRSGFVFGVHFHELDHALAHGIPSLLSSVSLILSYPRANQRTMEPFKPFLSCGGTCNLYSLLRCHGRCCDHHDLGTYLAISPRTKTPPCVASWTLMTSLISAYQILCLFL